MVGRNGSSGLRWAGALVVAGALVLAGCQVPLERPAPVGHEQGVAGIAILAAAPQPGPIVLDWAGWKAQEHQAHGGDDPLGREHEVTTALVSYETYFEGRPDAAVAIASGAWSDPGTWLDSRVPGAATPYVLIPRGVEVVLDGSPAAPIERLRVDGNLSVQDGTTLTVAVLFLNPTGTLTVGTPDSPIMSKVRFVIAGTPVADAWQRLRNGLILHGQVQMHGQEKTPQVDFSDVPAAGATSMTVAEDIEGWEAGDVLNVLGVHGLRPYNYDEVSLAAVDGRTLTFDSALEHDRAGGGIGQVVVNLSRSIEIVSADPRGVRGDVMLMHNAAAGSVLDNVGLAGLGRTRADIPATEPETDAAGNLVAAADNPIASYPLHVHHVGYVAGKPATLIRNAAVYDIGPFDDTLPISWGMALHNSYGRFEGAVVRDAAVGIATELGNEQGEIVGNLVYAGRAPEDEQFNHRLALGGFGGRTSGIWASAPLVKYVDNQVYGVPGWDGAIQIWGSAGNDAVGGGAARHFGAPAVISADAVAPENRAAYDAIAQGRPSIGVEEPPFSIDGITYADVIHGFEVMWVRSDHDGGSDFSNITGTRLQYNGARTDYSFHLNFSNLTLRGEGRDNPESKAALDLNMVNDFTVDNARITDYPVGMDLRPLAGTSEFTNSQIHAGTGVRISDSPQGAYTLGFSNSVTFDTLSERFHLNDTFNSMGTQDINGYFHRQQVLLGDQQLYFQAQAQDAVWDSSRFEGDLVTDDSRRRTVLDGLTTRQMYEQYGLAYAGAMAADDAVQVPGIHGLLGSRSPYDVANPTGIQSELTVDGPSSTLTVDVDGVWYTQEANLELGYNLLMPEINGTRYPVFVYRRS